MKTLLVDKLYIYRITWVDKEFRGDCTVEAHNPLLALVEFGDKYPLINFENVVSVEYLNEAN